MKKKTSFSIIFIAFFNILFFSIILNAISSSKTDKMIQDNKYKIMRVLLKKRIAENRELSKLYDSGDIPKVDSMPEAVLIGLPEGIIVTIVESYWEMKAASDISDREIFIEIEQHRKSLFPESGKLPSALTLSSYVKYRMRIEHTEGVQVGDKYIDEAIKIASDALRHHRYELLKGNDCMQNGNGAR